MASGFFSASSQSRAREKKKKKKFDLFDRSPIESFNPGRERAAREAVGTAAVVHSWLYSWLRSWQHSWLRSWLHSWLHSSGLKDPIGERSDKSNLKHQNSVKIC